MCELDYLVLRVIVLVTFVVPLDFVVRVTLVVVLPLFVTFTVLRVTVAIVFSFLNGCYFRLSILTFVSIRINSLVFALI